MKAAATWLIFSTSAYEQPPGASGAFTPLPPDTEPPGGYPWGYTQPDAIGTDDVTDISTSINEQPPCASGRSAPVPVGTGDVTDMSTSIYKQQPCGSGAFTPPPLDTEPPGGYPWGYTQPPCASGAFPGQTNTPTQLILSNSILII